MSEFLGILLYTMHHAKEATFPKLRVLRLSIFANYRKIPKISDIQKFAVIALKVEQDGFTLE